MDVLLDAGYEVGKSVERERKATARVPERRVDRVDRFRVERRYTRARGLELAKLLPDWQRAVPDVVDAASDA